MRVVGREFSNISDAELDNLVHQVREVTPSAIRHQQLDALHRDCGFCWNDIACILRVSDRTLRRRRDEFGVRVVGREFSNISDTELDNLVHQVREVTPSADLRMVQGSLRQRWVGSSEDSHASIPMQGRSCYNYPEKCNVDNPKKLQCPLPNFPVVRFAISLPTLCSYQMNNMLES